MTESETISTPILLVSCYELGHQPSGIATAMGLIERAGYEAEAMDVSVEGFDEEKARRARFVGLSVPMHTALRLGLRVAEAIRRINPECHICFYGMYASLNADYLLETVADSIIGGEFEQALVALIKSLDAIGPVSIEGVRTKTHAASPVLTRLPFAVPGRGKLPPLERYARLEREDEQRLVGYTEASRGCLHMCTHCPIPPVYEGRFFVVPQSVVLEDIRNLVSAGARHITFGDPDFLNGPTHSLRIAQAMHDEFPTLSYDFTAKVEHIIKHRSMIADFARTGCLFVVSAVESLSDRVLKRLEKGHTRAEVEEAFDILEQAGVALRPSFVSFTPWTSIDDFIEVLDFVEARGLIYHIDPVQYSIRLLIPPGSLLLNQPDAEKWLGPLVQESFTYEWAHTDPRMDALHAQVARTVEQAARTGEDARDTFYRVREIAYEVCGSGEPVRHPKPTVPLNLRPPRLTEAWFC